MKRMITMGRKMITWILFAVVAAFFITAPTAEAAPERKNLEIQAGMFGGSVYGPAYALTVIAKKYSKILSLTTTETTGTSAGLLKTYEEPMNRVLGGSTTTVLEAGKGMPPFDKPYPDIKLIGNMVRNITVLITLDPEIKTLQDLVGKRLGLGPKPTVLGKNTAAFIHYGNNIPDNKIKKFYMTWPRLKDAILDGSVDAMCLGVTMRPTGNWVPVPVYQEIATARKTISFLTMGQEAIKKVSQRDGIPHTPAVLPKDIISSGQPAKDIVGFADNLSLFAHKDLPSEYTYEIAKILYEHCEEMKETTATAKGTFKKIVADSNLPDEYIHPGALKYYKEKGIR